MFKLSAERIMFLFKNSLNYKHGHLNVMKIYFFHLYIFFSYFFFFLEAYFIATKKPSLTDKNQFRLVTPF